MLQSKFPCVLLAIFSFLKIQDQKQTTYFFSDISPGCRIEITEVDSLLTNKSYGISFHQKTSYDTYGNWSLSGGHITTRNDTLIFTEMIGKHGSDSIYDSFRMYLINKKKILVLDSVYCFRRNDTLKIRK